VSSNGTRTYAKDKHINSPPLPHRKICTGVKEAKVHSAKVLDHKEIKALLRGADERFPRLSHLWLDAG
jgi:hypothetical protein